MFLKSTIIFVEGLPGSGKTTFSKRLDEHYESMGIDVKTFNEGDLHPMDLAWCSITDKEEYEKLLCKFPKYELQINSNTKIEGDRYITAYTKVRVHDEDVSLYKDFEQYEIYRTDDIKQFKNAHLNLWQTFNLQAKENEVYIFECIFLQNHINELILKYNLTQNEIAAYFEDLVYCLSNFNVKLFYLKQVNIPKVLKRISNERRSDNPHYKDWIDLVSDYFENTRYGRELGYIGYDGVIKYFTDRQNMEEAIIPTLKIDSHIFNLDDNYDEIFNMMKNVKL